MALVNTEFVYANRVVVVNHFSMKSAHDYAKHVLHVYPNTVHSVGVRSSRRDGNVLLGIIKRRKKASC